jgi:uncharacterized membrane protein
MSDQNSFFMMLRRYFLAGVLVVVPLILTYLVLRFLFNVVDGILQPLIIELVGRPLPGLGILATLALVLVMGILTHNFIGRYLLQIWERLIVNVPLIKPIYTASKQLLEAIAVPSAQSFSDVVMIEYPRMGTWSLGFITNRVHIKQEMNTQHLIAVFVPSTPTPMSGFVVLTPMEQIQVITNMTIQEGVNYLVSGGVVSPKEFTLAPYTHDRTRVVVP